MKRILYIFVAFAVSGTVLTSCKKDYLNTSPTEAIEDGALFTDAKGGWAALNGIHRAMYSAYDNQDQTGQGTVMIDADMLGDDLVMTAAGNGWFNSTYQWTMHRNTSAAHLKFVYYFYYRIIANANKIIEHIDQASGSDADKNAIKGEALAYRGWAHFQLVQLFGSRYDATKKPNSQDGVPLLTKFTIEPQPRASVEDVYAQVNKDLDASLVSLAGYKRAGKSHFDSLVVFGLKARVALTMQDWSNAAKYAVKARTTNTYGLMTNTDYVKGFNSVENREWLWGSYQTDDQTTAFNGFFAYMSINFSSTNIRSNPKAINKLLYARLTATDVRSQLWDPTGKNFTVPAPSFKKFPYMNQKFVAKGASSSVGDVPYMRIAEMYLIEAEAQAQLGQDGLAADALFAVANNRDPKYTRTTNTGQALKDEIAIQRRLEFWGEGFRFFDLKRQNLPLDRTNSNHDAVLALQLMKMPAGDNQWQWLFPQDEINANPKLVQNPL
ncbi:SusD-like starch-binding protein associating with outer membrane [Chitinophaga niastensis]|uniref:SusD-like starch-binding protein associating with outer membrane n=1 Tax=Chitinophaga niastensis TaxID=536980 RepID=A0A2P8HTS5_CHINA|nr:RagB/SusD family nutrient uptake outer membrane protein [Chitinophaga niastensis]PSL49626.1 SusD-like starch-binding protein associating with outer membrane [Chitinophaga niastensis]